MSLCFIGHSKIILFNRNSVKIETWGRKHGSCKTVMVQKNSQRASEYRIDLQTLQFHNYSFWQSSKAPFPIFFTNPSRTNWFRTRWSWRGLQWRWKAAYGVLLQLKPYAQDNTSRSISRASGISPAARYIAQAKEPSASRPYAPSRTTFSKNKKVPRESKFQSLRGTSSVPCHTSMCASGPLKPKLL